MSDFQTRLTAARDKAGKTPLGGTAKERKTYRAVQDELAQAEFELAFAQGEECARPVKLDASWDPFANPLLLTNGFHHSYLIIALQGAPEFWLKSEQIAEDLRDPSGMKRAVLRFQRCIAAKLGYPNDEAFPFPKLRGKGICLFEAHIIENSSWIAQLEANNAHHPRHDPASWQKLNHYLISFKESTFECIAESFQLEKRNDSIETIVSQILGGFVEIE